jgi:peptidoglycan/xylan/chitin deacetylase (PgdA/CDA1 family)
LTGLSKLQKLGLLTVLVAAVLGLIDPPLAAIPVAMLLLLLLSAPFVHRLGIFMPVISRGQSNQGTVALTFDDGPDPMGTPALLRVLKRRRVQATFFTVGQQAAAHPELIRAILAHGHTIGNHGYHHDTLAAFKGARRVRDEIVATQRVLADSGVTPLVFRPPVGITYPAMGAVLARLNMTAVTFSCRAWDCGNRSIAHISRRILNRVKPGDIIMLHDRLPPRGAEPARWLDEVDLILTGLNEKGLAIRPLAELIGRPVDRRPANQGREKREFKQSNTG